MNSTENLKLDEAHIWYLRPDEVSQPRLRAYERILSPEEWSANASFRFERHRHAHLLTKAFVRLLLARYGGIAPEDWVFSKNAYGRPEIAGPSDAPHIKFSISHTDGLIAYMLALGREVGVDVENTSPSLDRTEVVRKYFSPIEQDDLRVLSEPVGQRRFFEYWTLKEAYTKACGLGLSEHISRLTFHLTEPQTRISFDGGWPDDPADWQFQLFYPTHLHVLAVASRLGDISEMKFRIRDGTALIS
jgi:4'-phosphopantetheinyl transferase